MYKHFFSRKQKLIVLILLSLGMTFTNLGLSLFNSPFLDFNYEEGNIIDFEDQYILPKTAEYQSYDGSGKDLNITVHQSLIDTTTKQFTDLDSTSTFTEPFPIFSGFNTSFVNISISNIDASNKSLIIEDSYSWRQSLAARIWSSFEVRGDGFLENISISILNDGGDEDYNIRLYNGELHTYLSTNYIRPKTSLATLSATETVLQTTGSIWLNLTYLHERLNVSDTYNNTFFIAVQRINDYGEWEFENQGDGDDSIVWDSISDNTPVSRDQLLKVDVSPLSNSPSPSEINLQVNSTSVSNTTGNNGFWSSTEEFRGYNGNIDFEITADWWEVSCDVTNVQINYTKSDITANADFQILSDDQDAQWNVTIPSGLNYFDSRIADFNTVNFTIPAIWKDTTIKVFNGGTDKTSDSLKRLLNNNFREVQVLNANNGTFWYLTANSSNLITQIDTYVSGFARSMVNFSNTLEINSTFSEIISTGSLNLSIFSPVPQYLNHTKILDISILSPSTEFQVSNWDIFNDITSYGIFKIQISWSNDTAAGFLEDYVTIIADTNLDLTLPKTTFDSGDLFNMTVFYNDTGQDLGIEADVFSYQIGAGNIRTTENITYLGNGYYNITFSCNDTDFNYGLNTIIVNTTKQYYNNQSESKSITILGETEATILYPPNNAVFDSGDTFDLTIFYNDTVKDLGIAGATINYSLNGGISYRFDNINYIGSGEYNITISASDSDFNGYGTKNIIVNSSKQYYYNQSNSLTLNLLGETSLSSQKIPAKPYYTAAESFNISVYYNDTVKSLGINGARVDIDVDGTIYNPIIFDNGDGYYNITIDCSDSIFEN